ncbi:glycosyltransferase family 4 protein [Flavobacterium sediminilitoris]|uniref:Glycosyltransferase family 4 protein n=1 Tax=Flavobacterium sediminilitoris TaxID=2024526 RepID=A0ABY4HP98_9FLAO|nr:MULTISPECIES: glycosyltransferase family 4 protein [Flavobacterium]UOX34027.1 glycosyltransferase family 4 protein [Flavobacterium sediminilitoris]
MEGFSFENKTVVLMIKVAMLGGAERQALGLADYLSRKFNCNIYLVATHSNKPTKEFKDFAESCGVDKVYYFGEPSLTIRNEFSIFNLKKAIRAIKYIYKIKNEVKIFKPDVIIPFLNTPSKIAALIYKSVNAKVTFWHQLGLDNYTYDWLEKKAIKNVPFIIANAENGLKVFKEYYNIPKEKLFVLPQYVSISKISIDTEKLRIKFKIPKESIVIGMIAHYRNEKLQKLLLQSFSEINTNKNIHLVFLGNKDNSTETSDNYNLIVSLSKSLNCFEKVSFLSGELVEEVLNCLDIGVLVSEIEGTPNVVMEYMLYGLPIIASNHDGCIGLLEESEFLIPNEKVTLTNKLTLLIEDDELRKKESDKNISKIKKYSIDNYISQLTSIINK